MTSTLFRRIVLATLCLTALGCQNPKSQQEREWKALCDTIADCSQKISNIVGMIQQSGSTTEATQQQLLHEIDSIDRMMKDAIRHCGARNKDNDLGRYIRQNYKEE